MAYDVVKFVDSIAASPTTRLDVNDGAQWTVRDFSAPPPRIRRSAVSNAMTDGAYVSSSTYDARTLFLEIDLITTTQDTGATEFQKLARELDRSTNFLMYQPNALTKPVFFKTWRSDFSDVVEVRVVGAYKRLSIELLAEPFAMGLRETFSSTISMDGSNASGFTYTCPTILGDVAAPLRFDIQGVVSSDRSFHLATQAFPTGLTAPVMVRTATNAGFSLGTDASNATGLGTGYWNGDAVSVSFATATMATRASATVTLPAAGTYRVIARMGLSADATVNMVVSRKVLTTTAPTYTTVQTGDTKQITTATLTPSNLDMGLFRVPFGNTEVGDTIATTTYWDIQAERTSGAGNLRIDGLLFIPVDMDGAKGHRWGITSAVGTTAPYGSATIRVDAETERLSFMDGSTYTEHSSGAMSLTGGFPMVAPNCSNTIWSLANGYAGITTASSMSFSASYLPRYLYVRPSTT